MDTDDEETLTYVKIRLDYEPKFDIVVLIN